MLHLPQAGCVSCLYISTLSQLHWFTWRPGPGHLQIPSLQGRFEQAILGLLLILHLKPADLDRYELECQGMRSSNRDCGNSGIDAEHDQKHRGAKCLKGNKKVKKRLPTFPFSTPNPKPNFKKS